MTSNQEPLQPPHNPNNKPKNHHNNPHSFIRSLPSDILDKVKRLSIKQSLQKETAIYCQGDIPNAMYQLIEGKVRICNYSHDGKEIVLGSLYPGDCFGELGLVDELPRMTHIITAEHSVIHTLSKEAFYQLYNKYPLFSQQLNLMLCQRVRLLYKLNEDANSLSLQQRLSRTIHRMSLSIQPTEGKPSIDTTQEDLGRMLGASRQSINKELRKLEQQGCIELDYGKIVLKNIDLLKYSVDDLMGQG